LGAGIKVVLWHREKFSITSSSLILSMFLEVEYSKILHKNKKPIKDNNLLLHDTPATWPW
jgi:hypothetical protein